MRLRDAAALTLTIAVTFAAGCASGDDGSGPGGDTDGFPLPEGFTLLDGSTVVDAMGDAMGSASSVDFTAFSGVEAPEGDVVLDAEGTIWFYDTHVDVAMRFDSRGESSGESLDWEGEVIVLDSVGYLSGPWLVDMGVETHTPDQWVRVSAEDPGAPPMLLGDIQEIANDVAPEEHLAVVAVTTAFRPVEVVELPDGEPAVWYEGEADVDRADEVADDDMRDAMRQMASDGVETVPYRILLDRDNRPREFESEFVTDRLAITLGATYGQWGNAQPIEVPANTVPWEEVAVTPGF